MQVCLVVVEFQKDRRRKKKRRARPCVRVRVARDIFDRNMLKYIFDYDGWLQQERTSVDTI